jgi:hypothetical protein
VLLKGEKILPATAFVIGVILGVVGSTVLVNFLEISGSDCWEAVVGGEGRQIGFCGGGSCKFTNKNFGFYFFILSR